MSINTTATTISTPAATRFLCVRPCRDCTQCERQKFGHCRFAVERYYWSDNYHDQNFYLVEEDARQAVPELCEVADRAPATLRRRQQRAAAEKARRVAEASAWQGVRLPL